MVEGIVTLLGIVSALDSENSEDCNWLSGYGSVIDLCGVVEDGLSSLIFWIGASERGIVEFCMWRGLGRCAAA